MGGGGGGGGGGGDGREEDGIANKIFEFEPPGESGVASLVRGGIKSPSNEPRGFDIELP